MPSESSEGSITEITLSKLAESLNQYAASALTNLNVPEFRGSPGEDVRDFLGKFKDATLTLNDDMRCLAITKALTGSAKIWAKENLKTELRDSKWKDITRALKARFGGPNADMENLEKLGKLKFDPSTDTLLSYLERYAAIYRRAHKNAADSDIVRSLKLNLPRNVQRGLNMFNDDWTELKNVKDLYALARRVEDKLLAYEQQDSQDKLMKAEELTKLIKDVKELITRNEKKDPDPKTSTEALAIVRHQSASNGQENTKYHGDRSGKYSKRYDQPYIGNQYNNRTYAPRYPRDNLKRNAGQVRDNNLPYSKRPRNEAQGAVGTLVEAYDIRYGKPPGDCQICRGHHYHRHCPFKYLN